MSDDGDQKYSLVSAKANFHPEGTNQSENVLIMKAIERLRDDYLLEEFEWVIEGQGLDTLEEYLGVVFILMQEHASLSGSYTKVVVISSINFIKLLGVNCG